MLKTKIILTLSNPYFKDFLVKIIPFIIDKILKNFIISERNQ